MLRVSETTFLSNQNAHSINYEEERQNNYATLRDNNEGKNLGQSSSQSESSFHTEIDLFAELHSTRQILAQKEQEAALAASKSQCY